MAVQREPLAAPRLGQRELDLALTQPRCDVLIIGGGPAGLATAIELRQSSDLDVVVVEARDDPSERFGESVPPDILLALDRLDLTQAFKADGHLPCPGSVSLWGRDKPGHNDFILNPVGPAWHISRTRFEAMLRTRATQMGASICSGTRARTVTRTDDHFDLVLQNPAGGRRAIHAPWVIDASGGRAWFARRQGATRRRLDGMLAIVRFAALRSGTFTAQTIVEAAPDGWWYCARLPDALVVTMLITERHAARTLTQGGYARWRELLSQTRLLAPRLDACGLDDERFRLYAVASAILDHVEGPGWIAVGDAASVYDPITSQGIHKALADAADASRTIAAAAGHAQPPPWRYGERVEARFEDDLANRAHLYALERQWSDRPFWRHRAHACRGRHAPQSGGQVFARTALSSSPVPPGASLRSASARRSAGATYLT